MTIIKLAMTQLITLQEKITLLKSLILKNDFDFVKLLISSQIYALHNEVHRIFIFSCNKTCDNLASTNISCTHSHWLSTQHLEWRPNNFSSPTQRKTLAPLLAMTTMTTTMMTIMAISSVYFYSKRNSV